MEIKTNLIQSHCIARPIFFFSKLECVRRPDPPNGRIQCDSKRYAVGKSCYLKCNVGYIPLGRSFMTCIENPDIDDFEWSIAEAEFVCVRPVGFVIGGQDDSLRYLNDVEVLAPGFNCRMHFNNNRA